MSALLAPLFYFWRTIGFKLVQQFRRIICNQQHLSMLGIKETFCFNMIDKFQKVVVIIRDVQQPTGFFMELQLGPGQDFHDFFESAEATR